MGIPIDLLIGESREATLKGSFVAFSKRINSVLVPESFLTWSNEKFGKSDASQYFYIWKDGAIDGPPRTLEFLQNLPDEEKENGQASPISSLTERKPISEILQGQDNEAE